MKQKREFSFAELILFIVVWGLTTYLGLRLLIPMIRGTQPIVGILLIASLSLLFLSSVMVYHVFSKPKKKDT